MPRCPDCGETDLHYEYIELRGLGWRPVWHNADGSRHRCGTLYQAHMRDRKPIRYVQPDTLRIDTQDGRTIRELKPGLYQQDTPTQKLQSVPPVSRRRTVETSS